MRELETEYEGRVAFTIRTADPQGTPAPELEQYGVGNHGLVALDARGEVVATIPGHEFGREELQAVVEQLVD